MKLIIRNDNDVVLYAEDILALDENGVSGDSWCDMNFTAANARLEEVEELPALWTGGVWSFADGDWNVADEERYASMLAAAAALNSPVPEQVPMLNARLALIEAGHMANVNMILAAAPGIDGEKARTFFEFAENVRRDHPVVEALRTALGLTHAQIDDLFVLAITQD